MEHQVAEVRQEHNMKQFKIVTQCKGYRAREDITNLPPGYLVKGSVNVLTNSANRLASRMGFTLDGAANAALTPIESSYDWTTHLAKEFNLRSFDTKLQVRWVDSAGVVSWITLKSDFTAVAFNYAEFWDTTLNQDVLLFVNGTSNIYEWSGGQTTFASATATTLTKQGTTTWAEEGFYDAATRSIVIGGVSATYTGGESTTTLTGVSHDFSGTTVGTPIYQAIRTTANSAMTGIPAGFKNDLISFLYNQIYVGSLVSRQVYVSKVNNYKDYSFSTVRVVGEGALLTLDACPTGLIPQEDVMYISGNPNQWYRTQFTLSADLAKEQLAISRLKTNSLTAAQRQSYITKLDNKVLYVDFEPTVSTIGRVDNIFATPDIQNLSDSIRDDMNAYNFSSDLGDTTYWKNFLYISIPADGVVLVYNVQKKWWEAPQLMSIGKFSIIGGELYGHSTGVPETYKLFDGYNDNGNFILSSARFSYQNFGLRANLKSFNEYYVEGYISSNTNLTLGVKYDVDGCATDTSYPIVGSDTQIVCLGGDDASLGKSSLGKRPLGGIISDSTAQTLPPKFRVIKTFGRKDFFEVQFWFQSEGADQRWELLAFGPEVAASKNDSVFIKQ